MTTDPKITKQTLLPPLPDPRSQNSVKHGILSEHVPAWERDGYAAHVQAVRDSVGAGNYLEQRLADRAALALWRLDRVARWEAKDMETEARRFQDRLQTTDPMAGLLASYGQQQAPPDARGLRDTLQELARLTGEKDTVLLRDPDTVELVATDRDLEAQAWQVIGSDGNLESIQHQQRESIGIDLIMDLQERWNASPERVARVILERKPTRDEAQAAADWDWSIEANQLPRLVAECQRAAGADWNVYVTRKCLEAETGARDLRTLLSRLWLLVEQELASATEPNSKRLEKVTRYEAHLERVLYRSLGELREMRTAESELPLTQVSSRQGTTIN